MIEKEVYNSLMAVLTEQQEDKPAVMAHFDWYNQQDQDIIQRDNNNDEEPDTFPFPAVFLSFPTDIDWEYRGAKMKEAYTKIELVIIQEQHQDINSNTAPVIKDAGLAWMDELDRVVELCEASRADHFDKVKHVNTRHDHNHFEIRTTRLLFNILLRDLSRMKQYQKVTPDVTITTTLKA
ncbi:MAG: hypothetical protein CL843_16360 [Crocinitomicaceae bacterium]|nr:hypothetical protein [Crocinitomicaceae bacterium]|tara:strand:+ start:187 stop:726 length:540 start_codon:yes stop_codon:yes gene_type:complete